VGLVQLLAGAGASEVEAEVPSGVPDHTEATKVRSVSLDELNGSPSVEGSSAEQLLSQLRTTHDENEKRALTEAVLALGYPWALELDPEHLSLLRRPPRSGKRWLVALVLFGVLSLGLASRNLWVISAEQTHQTQVPTSARSALSELNRQRVARSVETIEGLLREGQHAAAREAALRCLVIDHPATARCAQLYVGTLAGLEAARAQQRLRDATDARVEVMAFVSGTTRWADQPETGDDETCATQLRWVRPGSGRATVMPPCAKDVLQARLDGATREPDGWNLRAALAWQDSVEAATLRAITR